MMILKCRLTTIETMLGTASNNKELHSEFIASHAPDAKSREEEIEAVGVEEMIEKGMTVFPRNKDGKPILWDYQIKGFFKDACSSLRKVKGSFCLRIISTEMITLSAWARTVAIAAPAVAMPKTPTRRKSPAILNTQAIATVTSGILESPIPRKILPSTL